MMIQSVDPSTDPSSTQAVVDIDSYFDALDFDVDDMDDLDFTGQFIKATGLENSFQLPIPTYEPAHPSIKQPLDQVALEHAAYEVRLLARQLDHSPFVVPLPQNFYKASRQRISRKWAAIRHLPAVALGLLLTSLPAYVYTSRCSTAIACFEQAKHQLANLPSIRLPSMGVFSSSIAQTVSPSNAIASGVPSTSPASPKPASPTDPFRDAVNQAMRAAELTQTASQSSDWETVASAWVEAIRLMNKTPSMHPRYSTALLKVEEYAKNLAYAQRRMREATTVRQAQDLSSRRMPSRRMPTE